MNVFAFIGVNSEWRFFNYPMTVDQEWQEIKVKKIAPQQFQYLLEQKDLYILDVRPLDFRVNTSFIKGSLHCPLVYLADKYQEIPQDRQIVITDYAMKQSPIVAKFLVQKGYSVIGVLKGGVERWNSENLPVEHRVPTQKVGPLSGMQKK